MALKNRTLPDRIVTVFAGADIEATDHARGYFKGYPPSSPSVGLLRDGELVYILQRHQIEGREAPQIAGELTAAFDRYCTKEKVVS
jgi:putative YphP/YqiW family bacilliredoxin